VVVSATDTAFLKNVRMNQKEKVRVTCILSQ